MKILLALDSSPDAIEEAVRLAKERGASLTALFVLDASWSEYIGHDWLSGSNAREGFLTYISDNENALAEKTVQEFKERARGVASEIKMVAGRVPDEILRELKNGYDLLVMAAPFKRGLEILRNPAAKIIESAPCSVYLVKEPV
ncbi:MAG: universal stress protein [Nitrospirota bacterium]